MKLLYLLFTTCIFSFTAIARYDTPGTFKKWNLDSLVQYSGGAVTFNSGSYQVNDLIFITLNDTLSITTNAVVKFATATYLDVNGTLNINPPDSVLFTAQNAVSGYSGVRIDSSNTSIIRKLTLEYALSLRLANCSPLVDSCIFRYNSFGGTNNFGNSAITLNTSNAIIRNCQFLNNQRAAIAGGFNIANAPQIINNIFRGNNTQNTNVPQINMSASGSDTMRILNNQVLRSSTNSGGIGFLASNSLYVVITGNVIKNNRYGLTFNGGSNINALVSYNQIDSNNTQNDPLLGGSGIAFSGGTATSHQNVVVTGNLFRWNLWGITVGATTTGGGAKPNLGNISNTDTLDDGKNIFVGNTNISTPNTHLYNNNVDSIYAQNNYWAVDEGASVESYIFHKPDNAALGFVNYLPLYNPLPVKLLSFTALTDKNYSVLNWKTASENNSDNFTIEKSTDGRAFYTIGKVQAAGNSSLVRSYQFTDTDAFGQKEMIYYRLKQVDKDGKFTYSPVVSVKQNKPEALVKLYPTVINASQLIQAEITSSKSQTVAIRFYNAAGVLLMQTSKALVAGKNIFSILFAQHLPTGKLFVQFKGEAMQETVVVVKR